MCGLGRFDLLWRDEDGVVRMEEMGKWIGMG
jgi:hypothetical protein